MNQKDDTNQDTDSRTYNSILEEVEGIVEQINQDDCDLDHMVTKVEQGYSLIQNLRRRLNETREKIETLQLEYSDVEKLDENQKQ